MSVSPVRTLILSMVTPSAVAATWAMTASVPWPCSVTPVWTIIFPVASRRSWHHLRRDGGSANAVEHSTRVGHFDKGGNTNTPDKHLGLEVFLAPYAAFRNPSSGQFSQGFPDERAVQTTYQWAIYEDSYRLVVNFCVECPSIHANGIRCLVNQSSSVRAVRMG